MSVVVRVFPCPEAVLWWLSTEYSMLSLMSLRIHKTVEYEREHSPVRLYFQTLLLGRSFCSLHRAQYGAHFLDNVNKMAGNFVVLQDGNEGLTVHPVISLDKFDKTLKCCCFILSYFSNVPCQPELTCCPTTLLKPAQCKKLGMYV